jgi:hypothetical protein
MKPPPVTTDELRAAFNRVRADAPARLDVREGRRRADLIRWSLEKSALAHRQTHHLPAQPRLI